MKLIPLFCAVPFLFSCGGGTTSSSSEATTSNGTTRRLVDEDEKPTFFFLGSSVTYGATTNGKSFVENVANDLSCNVIKEAVSGTNLADTKSGSYVDRFLKKVDVAQQYDHFIIQLSTNDATNKIPYGSVSTNYMSDSFDTKTTAGAIEFLIAYIDENFGSEITFYTNPYYQNERYAQLVSLLDEIVAKWDFVHVLDYYRYTDMEPLDEATLKSYMSDNIHPNEKGYKWMSGIMEDHLVKVYEDNHGGLTIRESE